MSTLYHSDKIVELDGVRPMAHVAEMYLAEREALAEAERLRALVLEMGPAIRRIDVDHEYLEFWTQEGEYVLDGRFRHE